MDGTSVNAFDIVIVGGGMVGATLASLLHRANPQWSMALVERIEFPKPNDKPRQPSFDDRSTAIAHGSVELLKYAGIWSAIRPQATAIETVHVSDRGHFGGALLGCQDFQVDALGYVVANAALGTAVLEHLRDQTPIRLYAPDEVSQIVFNADAAELQLASQERLQARLVVIADGAQSHLCQRLGIEFRVDDYHQQVVIANVETESPHGGIAYERFTDQGPLALLPLDGEKGRRSALVWTQPEDQAEALLQASDEQFLKQLQDRFGYRLGRFISVGKRDHYGLQLSVASEQVRRRVVVMGNAAHFLHPVAGQGFNLALRDCAALADTLRDERYRQDPGDLAGLQAYLNRQQTDQAATITFSDQLTRLFSTSRLPQAVLRAAGFIGLECVTPAKALLGRQTMGQLTRQINWHHR